MALRRLMTAFTLIALITLAGCAASQGATTDTYQTSTPTPDDSVLVDGDEDIPEGVTVIVDEEREVVCYLYRDDANGMDVGGTGGISCLPFDEVNGYGE